MIAFAPSRVVRSSAWQLLSFLLAVLLAGGLAATSPALAIVLGLGIGVAAVSVLQPAIALTLAVLSVAVSPEHLELLADAESAITRGHRLLVAAAIVPALLLRGLRRRGIPLPVLAYFLVLLLSFSLASRHVELTPTKAGFALVSLTVGWMASRVVLTSGEQHALILVIAVMPLLSVGLGFGLELGGLHALFQEEYTGVSRLQGASIPAYLGMMGAAGAAASVLVAELGRPQLGVGLAFTNLLIIALSGTRGALAVTLVLMLPMVWRLTTPRDRPVAGGALRLLLAFAIAGAALAVYLPVLLARSTDTGTSESLDTSGRTDAWAYYIERAEGSQLFGLGLGAAPLVGEETVGLLRGDFRGAHNEYVRLYVEAGLVGSLVVLAAIVAHVSGFVRGCPSRLRAHLLALCLAFALYAVVENVVSTFQFFLPIGVVLGIYGSSHALAAATRRRGACLSA